MQNYSDNQKTFELKSVKSTVVSENNFKGEATSPIQGAAFNSDKVIKMPVSQPQNIVIIKKDGTQEEYNVQKVVNAVKKSAARMLITFTDQEIDQICQMVNRLIERVKVFVE